MPEAIAHWPDVKATAIATGSLKDAAAAHSLPYSAVKMRASREQWPVGQRVHKQAREAQAAASQQITLASDAIANTLEKDGKAAKLASMRLAKLTLEAAAERAEHDPERELARAGDAKAMLQTAAIAGNWQASSESGMSLQLFSIAGDMTVNKQ
jgi:hypothetical protein